MKRGAAMVAMGLVLGLGSGLTAGGCGEDRGSLESGTGTAGGTTGGGTTGGGTTGTTTTP